MITTAKKIGRLVNNLRWFTNPTTLMRSHRDAMAALKNKHKNTPALIIGNGPSFKCARSYPNLQLCFFRGELVFFISVD